MTKDLTEILKEIREKVTDDSDLMWTSFETADELRKEIDKLVLRLNSNDKNVLKDIYVHFLPTYTFQEHSMQNGWSEEYMKFAEQFDRIYKSQKL